MYNAVYKELGLEFLRSRRTFRRLCSFDKIISTGLPTYFLFPRTIGSRNNIHPVSRNASLTVFKKHLLKEILPVTHSVYNICNPNGLKLLTRLRLGFKSDSHLPKKTVLFA